MTLNFVDSLMAGKKARSEWDGMDRQNALASLYKSQGPGLVAGDSNAINALAAYDPAQAVKYSDRAASQASAERKSKLEKAGIMAGAVYNAKSPEAFEQAKQSLASMGLLDAQTAAQYSFADREALLGAVRGLEGNISDAQDRRDFDAGMQKWMASHGLAVRGADRADAQFQHEQQTDSRDFQYKVGRDQVGDNRYADETQYSRGRDQIGDRRYESETEYSRGRDQVGDQQWQQSFGAGRQDAQATQDYRQAQLNKPPAPSNRAKMAAEMGYAPGTREFIDFVGKDTGARVTVNNNAEKPFTESQAKLALFSNMMDSVSPVLDRFEGEFTPPNYWQAIAGDSALANQFVKTPEFQQYQSAQRQWAEGLLRIQTGAAATEPEIVRVVNTYFPQPGDDPQTVRFKQQQRLAAMQAIKTAGQGRFGEVAAPNFEPFGAQPSQAPDALPPTGSMSTPPAGQPSIDDLLLKYGN